MTAKFVNTGSKKNTNTIAIPIAVESFILRTCFILHINLFYI